VYTYPEELGWGTLNLISTIGAVVFASGVLLVVIDLIVRFRVTNRNELGNLWNAGTLEWLPNDTFGIRSLPIVESRYPLWDQPHLARDVEAGRYYLSGAPTGGRETLATSAVGGAPEFVMRLPMPGWAHVSAALFTALTFLSLTVAQVIPAAVFAVLAVVSILVWLWDTDPEPTGSVPIADGVKVPSYATGPRSISWWAMVLLMLVGAALYLSYVFSYLYLWTVSPEAWPGRQLGQYPAAAWPVAAGVLLLLSGLCIWLAGKALPNPGEPRVLFPIMVALAAVAVGAALAVDLLAQLGMGLRPSADSYAAMTFLGIGLQGQLTIASVIAAGYLSARYFSGKLDSRRRLSFETVYLLWLYAVGQGVFGLLLMHGFPRLVAS
jgi:cytochrome c oxidase subunit I+III